MKKKSAHQGMSIFKKTHFKLWLFFCIFFFFVFIAGLILQFEIIRNDEFTQKQNRCSDIAVSLNNLMSMVDGYSSSILYDDSIQELLYAPSGDRYQDDQAFKAAVTKYIVVTDCISAVCIQDADGIVYNYSKNSGSMELSSFPEEPAGKSWSIQTILLSTKEKPEYSFTLTRPVYHANSGKFLGYIRTFINPEQLKNLFGEEQDELAVYYLADANNRIVLHMQTGLVGTEDTAPVSEPGEVFYQDGKYTFYMNCMEESWTIRCKLDRKKIFDRRRMAVLFLTAGFAVILMGGYFVSSYSARKIMADICELTAQVEGINGFSDRIHIDSKDEVGTLACAFNALLDKNNRISEDLVEEQRWKRKYQVKLLQEQINPHFLYNTLDNIGALAVMHEDELVVEMIESLSDFYRGILSKGDTVVTLSRELEICESYLKIMQIRKHAGFRYSFDIDQELLDNVCLKILLQPILENCICHGFCRREENRMFHIAVKARKSGNRCVLSVTDNGAGMEQAQIEKIFLPEQENGFGLYSSRQRLQLYFGQDYGLEIESELSQGTKVTIYLPLCGKEQFEQENGSGKRERK